MAGVMAAAVLTSAWFVRRARIGARARAAADARLRITDRLARAVTPQVAARVAFSALAGAVVAGTVGALAGAVAGIAWTPLERARWAAGRAAAVDMALPDMLRAVASALRAGANLPQAVVAARDEADGALRAALDVAIARLDVGEDLDRALDAFARAAATEEASGVVETIRIGAAAGAGLPAILDAAVLALEDRAHVAAERRAATAQGRMSAFVVGGLPLAFVGVGPGREHLATLTSSAIGWGVLMAGLVLECAGVLWTRALLRSA